jgi:hypothetical protein
MLGMHVQSYYNTQSKIMTDSSKCYIVTAGDDVFRTTAQLDGLNSPQAIEKYPLPDVI